MKIKYSHNITQTISRILNFVILFFIVWIITSCSNENDLINDQNEPSISELPSTLSSGPGIEFLLEGNIVDDLGINSIRIQYEEWFLDKTIIVEGSPTEYRLNYKFLVPTSERLGTSHNIKIEITDLGGNKIERTVEVILDFDPVDPSVTIISPLSGSFYEAQTSIPIEINVSDNFALQSLQLSSAPLNLNELITFTNSENSFQYTSAINVPLNLIGTVSIDVLITDVSGNTKTESVEVNVGPEVVYSNIYITGSSTWFGSDATKATIMRSDPTDDDWFIGEIYVTTNNNSFKFLGQLGSAPDMWGLDPNDNSQIINSQTSQNIRIPNGNGYYQIRFNPYTRQFTSQPLTVNIAQRTQMFLMGKGFVGYNLDWNFADGIAMTRDVENPYVFRIDIPFSNAVELKFLGQNNDWGPFDCGFVSGGQSQLPINFVQNQLGGGSPDLKFNSQAGNYRIVFDYFLLRTSIQPIN